MYLIFFRLETPYIYNDSLIMPEKTHDWMLPVTIPPTLRTGPSHLDDFALIFDKTKEMVMDLPTQLQELYAYARSTNQSLSMFLNEFGDDNFRKRTKRNILGKIISSVTGLVERSELVEIQQLIKKLFHDNMATVETVVRINSRLESLVLTVKANMENNRKSFQVIKNVFYEIHSTLDYMSHFNDYTSRQIVLLTHLTRQIYAYLLQLISVSNMIYSQLHYMEIVRDFQLGIMSPQIIPPHQLKLALDSISNKLQNLKPPRRILFTSLWHYYTESLLSGLINSDDKYLLLHLKIPIIGKESEFLLYSVTRFEIPLDINNPIGYQKVQEEKDYFLITPTQSSYIELTAKQLQQCRHGTIINCPYAFSRAVVGIQFSCLSAAFLGRTDLLMDLCEILVYPNKPLHAMSMPDANNTYIVTNPDTSYNLICNNIATKIPAKVLFRLQIQCDCNIEFSNLILYNSDDICFPTVSQEFQLDSSLFLVHREISRMKFNLELPPRHKFKHASTSKNVLLNAINQLQDLDKQKMDDGLKLNRLLTCIRQDSKKYYERTHIEFLADIPHIKSSSFQILWICFNAICLLFCLIVSIWTVRKFKLLAVLFALCSRPRVVQAAKLSPFSTTTTTPPVYVAVDLPYFTTMLQYLLFATALIMFLYKLYQCTYMFRANLICKNLFTSQARGVPLYMRIYSEDDTTEIYVARVPFDLDNAIITILPIPDLLNTTLVFNYCQCTAKLHIEWRNNMHFKLGIEQGTFKMPSDYTLLWTHAQVMAKILKKQRGTEVLPIHFLTRVPYKEFHMLTIYPEMVYEQHIKQFQVKRQLYGIPLAGAQSASAPPYYVPKKTDKFRRTQTIYPDRDISPSSLDSTVVLETHKTPFAPAQRSTMPSDPSFDTDDPDFGQFRAHVFGYFDRPLATDIQEHMPQMSARETQSRFGHLQPSAPMAHDTVFDPQETSTPSPFSPGPPTCPQFDTPSVRFQKDESGDGQATITMKDSQSSHVRKPSAMKASKTTVVTRAEDCPSPPQDSFSRPMSPTLGATCKDYYEQDDDQQA